VHLFVILLLLAMACHPAHSTRALHQDSAATHPVQEAPVVRGPTVVAFWLRESDTLAGGEGPDLLDNFRAFTAKVSPALEEAEIALVATTADSILVELEGGPRRVISLRGLDYPFGYVLVEPGYPESILTGVSTDAELLDEVTWYFGLDEADPDSLPGQIVTGRLPRARLVRVTPERTASEGRRYWAGECRVGESRRRCTPRRRES
jgi:hypothetical protein